MVEWWWIPIAVVLTVVAYTAFLVWLANGLPVPHGFKGDSHQSRKYDA